MSEIPSMEMIEKLAIQPLKTRIEDLERNHEQLRADLDAITQAVREKGGILKLGR